MDGRLLSINVGRAARGRLGGAEGPHRDLEGAGRRGRGWSAGSTSTATTRPTGRRTAASTAPYSSTRSSPTATGSGSSAATGSRTGSSARTSPSRGWPMTRCASVTATGSAQAIFEVTQPRVTCFRLGIRMDEPRMPSLLVAHRRPGFYLRVLQEGTRPGGRGHRSPRRRAGAADGRRDRRPAVSAAAVPARRFSGPCGSPRSARGGGAPSGSCSSRAVPRPPPTPGLAGLSPARVTEMHRESSDDRLVHADARRRARRSPSRARRAST